MMKRINWMTAIGGLIIFNLIYATTMIPLSIEELTDRSTLIITGKVVEINTYKNEENGVISREVMVIPDKILKGEVQSKAPIAITVWGGTVDDITMYVPGSPNFEEGEKVLLFLSENKGKKGVVGLAQGKFSLIETSQGVKAIRSLDDIFFVSRENKETDLRGSFYLDELIQIINSRKSH